MTVDELRGSLIDIIKSNPDSLSNISREAGVSVQILSRFIKGKGIPNFKSCILLSNYVDKKTKKD